MRELTRHAVVFAMFAVSLTCNTPSAHAGHQVFTQPREKPWRYVDDHRKVDAPDEPSFSGIARPGEFFVFQVVLVPETDTGLLSMRFSDLVAGDSVIISASALRCISLGGTNCNGEAFAKKISVPAGKAQVLWCGVDVPVAAKGHYAGKAVLYDGANICKYIPISLKVEGDPLHDHGEGTGKNLSRLRWLDSTVGSEPTVTVPYLPVKIGKRTVRVLGRELVLGEDGLPAKINSFFNESNTRVQKSSRPVIAAPFSLEIDEKSGRIPLKVRFGGIENSDIEAGWTSRMHGDGVTVALAGRLDYTGSGSLEMKLTALRDMDLENVRLNIPWVESSAKYLMGLHNNGGRRPESGVTWKWDTARLQDCLWMGDVNAGMLVRLKGKNYRRPAPSIYYKFQPIMLPDSWGNDGKGGIEVGKAESGRVTMHAFCGERTMKAGEELVFIVDFYLTPFRTLDTEKQWSVRFNHPHPVRNLAYLRNVVAKPKTEHGANVLNIHQAHAAAPYINYPYADDCFPELASLVKRGHENDMRVRIYYTTREVTQNMPELHALHSMNGEVIMPGPGPKARTAIHKNGPHPWLTKNLGDNFIPAWVDHLGLPNAKWDLSVVTTPDSRWNNFYLEGLRWMVDQTGMDGIYVDDTALDARSLRRARRILDRKPGRLIDFHTWNHFNEAAGYANNLNLYMELLPYFDRLWIGEGFYCNTSRRDFWLVEMSGLPFGVMSEMLQTVNPWRGLVFGEVARLGWAGNPKPIWEAWDKYGIKGTEFIGYFQSDCPVKSGRDDIAVTVYRGKKHSLLAIGSWAKEACSVSLDIDWNALGLNPDKATLYAPAISGFQVESTRMPTDELSIAPGRGFFLVLDETPRKFSSPTKAAATLTESFRDPFSAVMLEKFWKVVKSNKGDAGARTFSGSLQVTALANVHAGIECELPAATAAVELEIQHGTDKGQTWGPGVALVWKNGQTAKMNLRTVDMKFEVHAGDETKLAGVLSGQSTSLRILLDDQNVYFQSRLREDAKWHTVARLGRGTLVGDPTHLRIGKLALDGSWSDFSGTPGASGVSTYHCPKVFSRVE